MLRPSRPSLGGFTLIELMIVVAILAIIGTVAVPAFIKYMRRAKTTEAIDMLDKIYKGASDYYSAPRYQKHTASKLDCQFPATQAQTPIEGSCCSGQDSNNDDRCDARPGNWDTNTWSALKFQITEEHYFVYTFFNNGLGDTEAQFTSTANADLDCDGVFSTFQRYGLGDPEATDNECAVIGGVALYYEKETE